MRKVLLVDDDHDQLALRSMLLEHHGFEPACASDPEAAIEMARSNQPGVAVVDLRLPTEDQGWRLISRLKQALPEVWIVVLSGSSRTCAANRPESDLVNAWVTKGGGVSVLIDALNHLEA